MAAHDFVKIPLTEAFITAQNFDIRSLSETFSDSSTEIKDTQTNINGYSLLQTDHSSNTKRGGVGMYHKDYIFLYKNKLYKIFSYKRMT